MLIMQGIQLILKVITIKLFVWHPTTKDSQVHLVTEFVTGDIPMMADMVVTTK